MLEFLGGINEYREELEFNKRMEKKEPKKSQIIEKQINSGNKADYVACSYGKVLQQRAVLVCKNACSRFMGIESGFVICGAKGSNQTHTYMDCMRKPALFEVFGEGERNWVAGAYGKPKG